MVLILFFSHRFRWVFCQLEVLRDCFPANIRRTLDLLPKSLDETYVRVLSQIPEVNQAHAHRMLQCLMVAVRPLYVEELAELLAFDFDAAAEGEIPKFRAAWRLDNQTQAVLATCSSLVTIVLDWWSGRQVAQFSHFSVKEFLISNRLTSTLGDISRYHICPISAHTTLTKACLGLLLHLDDRIDEESINRFPLAGYAAEHWVEHAQFEDVAARVKDGMETLFEPNKPYFAAWIGIYDIDLDIDTPSQPILESDIPAKPNPLYYSVLCGFYDLVKHLANKYPQHVDAVYGRYRFPLLAALSKDHVEIAELLLELGANVDALEATGETILLAVLSHFRHNLVNIVKFLLKHGADVNRRNKDAETPLHLAIRQDRSKVPKILLEHGADANAVNIDGMTPLHILSDGWIENEGDALNYASILLKHGADMNRRDKDNETPFHLAIRWDRTQLVGVFKSFSSSSGTYPGPYTPSQQLGPPLQPDDDSDQASTIVQALEYIPRQSGTNNPTLKLGAYPHARDFVQLIATPGRPGLGPSDPEPPQPPQIPTCEFTPHVFEKLPLQAYVGLTVLISLKLTRMLVATHPPCLHLRVLFSRSSPDYFVDPFSL